MSLDKAILFHQQLKNVTLERSGASPIGGVELQAALDQRYEAGYQAASDKFNAQILQMRQQMQAHAHGVLARVEVAHEELTSTLLAQIPQLVTAGVYKIVSQMDAAALRARIEALVSESCPAQESVEVKICPSDLQRLQELDAEFAIRHPRLSFKADETLVSGDCIMSTKFGQVDDRLKTQLQRQFDELYNT